MRVLTDPRPDGRMRVLIASVARHSSEFSPFSTEPAHKLRRVTLILAEDFL